MESRWKDGEDGSILLGRKLEKSVERESMYLSL